jgi:hypothetical protein
MRYRISIEYFTKKFESVFLIGAFHRRWVYKLQKYRNLSTLYMSSTLWQIWKTATYRDMINPKVSKRGCFLSIEDCCTIENGRIHRIIPANCKVIALSVFPQITNRSLQLKGNGPFWI